MGLSTHILDTALGRPAVGVEITLQKLRAGVWVEIGRGTTDADGRCKTLLGELQLEAETYTIRFETAAYYAGQELVGLYPFVEIAFTVTDPAQHYHIPLLLTANGYTTYRGS
jgi:5-hydroxyisourate hydrolase